MLIRALLLAALAAAVIGCGAARTTRPDAAEPPRSAQAQPSTETVSTYVPWGETRESVCAYMRAEITAGRPRGEGEPSERPYDRPYLQGFAAPSLARAEAMVVRRLFGQPCEGIANVWAPPPSSFETRDDDVVEPFVIVLQPSVLRLPDGRSVLLAPVRPGDAHATTGFYGALICGSQTKPFAMDGGGTFGEPGKLSVPLHQPRGAFHVWLEGGGTWQGDTQGWAGVTDFSGAEPQHRGHFLTYGDTRCDRYAQEESGDALCRGATEYALTSVHYADNGPDELTLVWRLETYDEASGGRRVNQRVRTLRARYALRGGVYRLAGGEEPPRI